MDIKEWADAYEISTHRFTELAKGLSENLLDVKHPEGWSARQIIHHLADSEAQSYARLRRLIAEPQGSMIQGYDEDAWAREPILGYEVLPVLEPIAVFSAVRAASLTMIKRLNNADQERFGEHIELGRYTIEKWLKSYSKHPMDHADQLERAIRGEL